MGNFSRNTFDKTKGYTSVRLQQGVPLVDADWNEQADILRNQTNDSLSFALGTGVIPGSNLTLSGAGLQNDFLLQATTPGKALINGRVVTFGPIQYSKQPWTNATVAAAAGVPVIPALTTPSANRNDCVYLDIWEREVNSVEDPNLVNPVIGVETAVRTKWEIAVRVNENALVAPSPPANHTYMRLAILARTANNAVIGLFDPTDPTASVTDARPILPLGDATGFVTIPPVLLPVESTNITAWVVRDSSPLTFKVHASTVGTGTNIGYVIVNLPDGARFSNLTACGVVAGPAIFQLWRINHRSTTLVGSQEIAGFSVTPPHPNTPSPYIQTWSVDDTDPLLRVNNRSYFYALFAIAPGGSGSQELHGISIGYLL